MDIENIRALGLTTEDFELINKALENYASKGLPSAMIGGIIGIMITGGDPKRMEEFERKEKIAEQRRKVEYEQLKEDTTLVQSKIIALKRALIDQNLKDQLNNH